MSDTDNTHVRELLQRGNHYAANRQFSNAIAAYSEALLALLVQGVGSQVSIAPGLAQALVSSSPVTVSLDEEPNSPLTLLHHYLQGHGHPELADGGSATLFHPLADTHTVVVYHPPQESLSYGTFSCEIPGVAGVDGTDGTSHAFYLSHAGPDAVAEVLSDDDERRFSLIAYTLAHLADVRTQSMVQQYQEGPILIDVGIPAILMEAAGFQYSLFMVPTNAWTWAHWGEVYRNIANGWPGSIEGFRLPHRRVHRYLEAMCRYRVAIELNPREWWALTHFGAAIVNVRAFLGFTEDSDGIAESGCQEFDIWLEDWLSVPFPDVPTSPDPNVELLARASLLLYEGQRLQGNYYPWAQTYFGDTFLIMSLLIEGDLGRHLADLAVVETNDALFLQPELASQFFDPGTLYVNGFFQIALVYYWTRARNVNNLVLSWEYTLLGMGRMFNFEFLPGLYALIGYELLVNISLAKITEDIDDGQGFFHALPFVPLPQNVAVPTPVEPIGESSELIQFVEGIVRHVAEPTVRPFLPAEVQLNSKITVGLLESLFICQDFQSVLTHFGTSDPELDALIGEIKSKLGLPLDLESPTGLDNADNMRCMIFTGKPALRHAESLNS